MTQNVLIIAEAGVNHNGSLDLAKRLVDVAADAGADYVKFQTFKADKLVSRGARKASYQLQGEPGADESQYEMLRKLELSEQDHAHLIEYCKGKNIKFLSTGFDEEAIDFLADLGVDVLKIPSGEITNLPFLLKIASKNLPVIMSSGMCTMQEISDAVEVLNNAGVKHSQITILHCNTEYPTPFEDVNLKAMLAIRDKFNVEVGYSDHTLGIEVPIAAVAMGGKVIEKHFTIDRSLPGPDHRASLEPSELKQMVACIRNIQKAIRGDGVKNPSPSEMKNISVARKSIHVKSDIQRGQQLTRESLVMKRPGDGISPMKMNSVIGKTVNQDLAADTKLLPEHLT